MSKITHILPRWLPAVSLMILIFIFSSQPSNELPNFNWADTVVKKGGHVIGYAILALAYWHAFRMQENKRWLAWLLAVLYALTDEFHQSFVAGRHPSIWDVLIFDNLGAMISLWIVSNRTHNH
ncbi:MAG: VanZ family protein [Anaerolineales bacterium]